MPLSTHINIDLLFLAFMVDLVCSFFSRDPFAPLFPHWTRKKPIYTAPTKVESLFFVSLRVDNLWKLPGILLHWPLPNFLNHLCYLILATGYHGYVFCTLNYNLTLLLFFALNFPGSVTENCLKDLLCPFAVFPAQWCVSPHFTFWQYQTPQIHLYFTS